MIDHVIERRWIAVVLSAILGACASTSATTSSSPAIVPGPPARIALAALSWGLALVLLLPHLTLLLVSFVPVGTWTTEALPPAYTFGNYLTLLRDPVRARPLVNSLWMASLATVAAVAISVAAGVLAVRRRVRAGPAIESLLAQPSWREDGET